ncbi:MAG: MFS transporter [Deltaproteobacteria bacterium]|nr:MFS transporter [Deltaproteobacteria bacterium]
MSSRNGVSADVPNRMDKAGPPFGACLGPLTVLAGLFFLNFSARLLLGPLLLPIQADLDIPLARVGWFFLAVSWGYSAGILLSSQAAHLLTHQRNIACSMIGLGASMLWAGFAQGPLGLGASLIGLGLAAGLYLPSGVGSITDFVPSRHLGKAFALHECAPSLAFIVAPLMAEFFLTWGGWRQAFQGLGLLSLVSGGWYWFRGRAGRFPGRGMSWDRIMHLIRNPSFLLVALGFSLAIGAEIGVFHLTSVYLVRDHGLSRSDANLFLGISRVACLLVTFWAGWFVDRFGLKPAFGLSFGLAGLATIGIGSGSFALAGFFLFIQPVLTISFFPAGFSALARLAPEGAMDLAVALAVAIASAVGIGAIPAALAWVGDHFGLWTAFMGMGAVMLVFLPLLLRARL